MPIPLRRIALLLLAISTQIGAQSPPTSASTAATRDTSYIDAQGTAYVTRVVPVPPDLSPEARNSLIRKTPDQSPPESLEHRRAQTDAWAERAKAAWTKLCPNTITESTLAGVPVRIVTPSNLSNRRDRVLLNLHGGGFNSDSGSFTETIPIAGYTGIKVIAVLYRLAPEHPFPAAVDDAVAVYRELLKTYKPSHIVLYGTSAGAVLTAEVAVKLKSLGLPLPAGLGIFSTLDSFAQMDDSQALYTLQGFAGHLDPPDGGVHDPYYVGSTDPKDPVLSPIYADLHGLPPTLFLTSGRDALLSGTANLHRAYLRAGVDARLVLFDALPHAFWYDPSLPESIEANHIMANFMLKQLPN
jgi:monoterpene epsilon-lactone hydrolase